MPHPAAASPPPPRHARPWAVAGHGLFVLLVLAAYAARHVDPRTLFWWLQLLGIALPLLALAAAPIALVSFARRRWTLACAYGLCVVLVALRTVPSGADAPADATGPLLTVMTANAKGRSMERHDALAQAATRHAVDLLALQETPLYYVDSLGVWAAAPQVLAVLGRNGLAPGRIGDGQRVDEPVLSTLPWLKFERLVPILRGRSTPVGTRAEVEWHGMRVALYNVHLHSFRFHQMRGLGAWGSIRAWGRRRALLREDFRRRADEAAYLQERLRTERLPFVLTGDLNSTPHTWVYHQLALYAQDAYRAVRWNPGATYPSTWPLLRIDYVLTSGSWAVAAAEVGAPIGSDHRPLVVRLRTRTPHGDQ